MFSAFRERFYDIVTDMRETYLIASEYKNKQGLTFDEEWKTSLVCPVSILDMIVWLDEVNRMYRNEYYRKVELIESVDYKNISSFHELQNNWDITSPKSLVDQNYGMYILIPSVFFSR